jgi:hypothetical protein
MTNREKYCLINDDDGHWYLAPFERRNEAREILESIEEAWAEEANEIPEVPDWLKEIDGYHKLTFENPIEE